MDQRLFGLDISSYQGVLDWDVIASHVPKVCFVAIRMGISYAYVDSLFNINKSEAKRVNIPRGYYHVFYPDQSPLTQVASLKKAVGDDYSELPIIADIELIHSVPPAQYAINLKHYLDEIERVFGRKPIIYSRAQFLNDYVGTGFTKTYGNDYKYWLAQYLRTPGVEMTTPPTTPRNINVENVVFHQTGDTFPAIGGRSKSMDFNRIILGREQDFYNLLQIETPEPPPVVTPDDQYAEINTQMHKVSDELEKLAILVENLA